MAGNLTAEKEGKYMYEMSSKPEGLLFYSSGANGFTADVAEGRSDTTFLNAVEIKSDPKLGQYFECDDRQRFAYKAPGNIYAERGTLNFFWRSRYPVGPTEFPIFRVSFADHSSWEQVWLRIDYNGHGFEAFITDINLSRARVSAEVSPFPQPGEWTFLTVSWDEIYGIKLYVNGKLSACEERPAVYYTGLDQFGPHSRIVGTWNVSSAYNYIRGGDIAHISIFDHMLTDKQVLMLSEGKFPQNLAKAKINMENPSIRQEWLQRNGWDKEGLLPPMLPAERTSVRKVEIHDAYDLKRWWWKGCDGIRETTWPGVYNRSKLKGRSDYFMLPDWDCYSLSGKAITFHMPDEPWNHIEISGSAWGKMEVVDENGNHLESLFDRSQGRERSFNQVQTHTGKRVRFTNEVQEEPIGDMSVFYLTEGSAPNNAVTFSYTLHAGYYQIGEGSETAELRRFINGRYMPYERHIVTALPEGVSPDSFPVPEYEPDGGFPMVNIVIPYQYNASLGMDGMELSLPAFSFPGQKENISFSIQIKDPLWYYRNLAHFNFTVKPGEKPILWFDTRDRILPKNRCLYIMIACSNAGFTPEALEGASLRLVMKPAKDALEEHISDRITQVRDNYANILEEGPRHKEFDMFNRLYADLMDVLEYDPENEIARFYYNDYFNITKKYAPQFRGDKFKPHWNPTPCPEDSPLWAFRQCEYMGYMRRLLDFFIDQRQIENGEFGGGLSDDGDFTTIWASGAAMGIKPDKVKRSLFRNCDAFYAQGMFTNGLPSLQTDQLHSSEEGLISVNQCLCLDPSNPKYLEKAMETSRALWWITGVNQAGHRHIKSSYYNGAKMATEWPWGVTDQVSFYAFSPCVTLARYNGTPILKKILLELADGLAAHYHDGILHHYIVYETDEELDPQKGRSHGAESILMPAYRLTGDKKYKDIIPPRPSYERLSRGVTDKEKLAERYNWMVEGAWNREYINTLGHPWIDRITYNMFDIQADRMGGMCNTRFYCYYPENGISWKFHIDEEAEKLAVVVPYNSEREIKIVAFNISGKPITADIIGGEILPGIWNLSQGIDTNGDDLPDDEISNRSISFERSMPVTVTFPPKVYTIIQLNLEKDGVPYFERCDLGITEEDLTMMPHGLQVKIHSLGAKESLETLIALRNPEGQIVRTAPVRGLPAPEQLFPIHWEVPIPVYGLPQDLTGWSVEIDPENRLHEITRANNMVVIPKNLKRIGY